LIKQASFLAGGGVRIKLRLAGTANRLNVEHRTLNVQHRILYSVNFEKTEQHAAQAPALRERIHDSKFPVFRSRLQRDSLVLKSIKRSVINIRRSMLKVRCSTFIF
jgi:hypothetical protein